MTNQRTLSVLEGALGHHVPKWVLCLLKTLIIVAVSAALVCGQILPRFELFRTSYYGWPFVHVIRHVEVVANEPPDIRYVVFAPGVIFDLLAWGVLMLGVLMALKPSRRGRPIAMQIQINTMLWLLTAVAVLLALHRADPHGFWALNRILGFEPRWMHGMLFFGIGCVVYVTGRAMAQLSWEAFSPHVNRIASNLRR